MQLLSLVDKSLLTDRNSGQRLDFSEDEADSGIGFSTENEGWGIAGDVSDKELEEAFGGSGPDGYG